MINELTIAAVSAGCTALLALTQCGVHEKLIRSGAMTTATKVRWAVARTLCIMLICGCESLVLGGSPMQWTLLTAGCLLLFPALFNNWLNTAMGWDKDYLGATSLTDRTFILASMYLHGTDRSIIERFPRTHQSTYYHNAAYREAVHFAGRASFIGLTVAAIACYILSALI